MSPPKKLINTRVEKKEAKEGKGKKEEVLDAPKLILTPGSGWTSDNFLYMKTSQNEQIIDDTYAIFGIPIEYKYDTKKIAYHIFVEYHVSSFQFAQQFQDVSRAMNVLAILSDYISLVPAFANSKEAFSEWIQKATEQIRSLEFTANESQAVISYLNKSIKTNSHIMNFIFTKESIQELEKEGLRLFRTSFNDPNDSQESRDALAFQKQSEFEAQQLLIAQAMKEKKEAEEKQKQAELAAAIEQAIIENFSRIQNQIDLRNEQIMSHILSLEEKIDGPQKGKK